jgi:K+ transporter
MVVTVKYVIAILSADNRGEGGTFSLLGNYLHNSFLLIR